MEGADVARNASIYDIGYPAQDPRFLPLRPVPQQRLPRTTREVVEQTRPVRTVDVRMPDGTVVTNVPEGTPKEEVVNAWLREGLSNTPQRAFFNGVADMLSFGGLDEVAATLHTLGVKPPGMERPTVWNDSRSFGDIWTENQRRASDALRASREANPASFMTGQVAGGLAPLLFTGGASALAQGGGTLARAGQFARSVAPSAAQGGAYAFGSTDGSVEDRLAAVPAGAALGVAGDLGGRLVGKAVSRLAGGQRVSDQVRRLADSGVVMSPGQRAGPHSLRNRTEQMLMSVPVVREMIAGARARGVRDLNEAVINEALSPIGGKIPAGQPITRQTIAAANDAVTGALGEAASRLKLPRDTQLDEALSDIVRRGRGNVGPLADQLEGQIDNIVNWRLANGGASGQTVRDILSEIRQARSSFAGSSVANERNLGQQLGLVEDALMDAIERGANDPNAIKAFIDARRATANMARLNKAAARATEGKVNEGALMTPSQILSAVKSPGYGVSARRVARGEAPMQRLAEAGAAVLPDNVPNSGTVDRGTLLALIGAAGAGGGGAALSDGDISTAGFLAAPFLLYTKAGQRALQAAALTRPAAGRAIGAAIDNSTRALGRLGATGALGLYPFTD